MQTYTFNHVTKKAELHSRKNIIQSKFDPMVYLIKTWEGENNQYTAEYYYETNGVLLFLTHGNETTGDKLHSIWHLLRESYTKSSRHPELNQAFFSAYVHEGKEDEYLVDYEKFMAESERYKNFLKDEKEKEKQIKKQEKQALLAANILIIKEKIQEDEYISAQDLILICNEYNVKLPIKTIGAINKGNIVSCNSNGRFANDNISFAICDYYKQVKDILTTTKRI